MNIILRKPVQIKADCFKVDYTRLNPDGWPVIAPVEMDLCEQPRRSVNRAWILSSLAKGHTMEQVAVEVGCSANAVFVVKHDAMFNGEIPQARTMRGTQQ